MWLFLRKVIALYVCEMIIIYIQFSDWFFTCLALYVVSFYLNYCSKYVCGCFYKNFFSLYDFEMIIILCPFYWLILYLFRSLFFFFSIWIIVVGMFVGVLPEAISLYVRFELILLIRSLLLLIGFNSLIVVSLSI